MDFEEIITKIEEELKLITRSEKINTHIENFRDKNSKPTYLEIKLPNKDYEETFSTISNKLIKMVRNNSPQILINYNKPHPHHNTNLRRFIINIDESVRKTEEKEALLKEAAIDFYGILKRWRKYGTKK